MEVLGRLHAIDECKLILIYVPDVVLDLFQVIHLFGYLKLFCCPNNENQLRHILQKRSNYHLKGNLRLLASRDQGI